CLSNLRLTAIRRPAQETVCGALRIRAGEHDVFRSLDRSGRRSDSCICGLRLAVVFSKPSISEPRNKVVGGVTADFFREALPQVLEPLLCSAACSNAVNPQSPS